VAAGRLKLAVALEAVWATLVYGTDACLSSSICSTLSTVFRGQATQSQSVGRPSRCHSATCRVESDCFFFFFRETAVE
jgi:hypothetical protein